MINVFKDEDKLVVHKQTDPNATLRLAGHARAAHAAGVDLNPYAPSDSWHVGRIDKHVLENWVKDAGVSFSDRQAVSEIIRAKLLDGDFQAFRVKEGTF